ncbi:MAG: hypothetical protein WGN25_14995 [Candidatus Electrothrix sp. GW3-4]|uniref:hypothetical protein n=1 Tax=Candidatus Electrothrix sp. GW3-4 TaxID=3126740 RepID=UPI0030D5FB04
MSANAARQDSDRDFLIIADHPLDREIITKLKDGLYDIELENNEVVSSIIQSRQEWSSPEYDTLPCKKAVEGNVVLASSPRIRILITVAHRQVAE